MKARGGRASHRHAFAPPAPVAIPAPLLEFVVEDITWAAGRMTGWPARTGQAWARDDSEEYFTWPAREVGAIAGYDVPRFSGIGAEKTKLLLSPTPLSLTASPWTLAYVVAPDQVQTNPNERGYILVVENGGTSGADDSVKFDFPIQANFTGYDKVGFYDTRPDVGSGWHMFLDSQGGHVFVETGWQVGIFSINPGGTSFFMRNGIVRGTTTEIIHPKKAFGRICLGSSFDGNTEDSTYMRALFADVSMFNLGFTVDHGRAWTYDKFAKFELD